MGCFYIEKVAVDEKTVEDIELAVKTANQGLIEAKEALELGRPHYNLDVTFLDSSKEGGERYPKEIKLKKGELRTVGIVIHNRDTETGKARRRADDVSCLVRFPAGFTVSAPWTTGHRNIFRDYTRASNGMTIVSINYGEDYALHPYSAFLLFVEVKPDRVLDHKVDEPYEVTVWADANNPHSKNPAVYTKLPIYIE